MNSKNAASSYLKSDSQTMWARNAANATAGGKRKRSAADDPGATTTVPEPVEVEVCHVSSNVITRYSAVLL